MLSTLLVVLFVSTVSASLLPVEPGGPLPIGAIKQALQREKLKVDHYTFGVANSAIRFKGHSLGETAQVFYSIARMAESKGLTKDYCKALLGNSKVEQAHKKAKRNVPVDGCQRVMAALRGEDVKVGNRFAWELGPGEVTFHSGKLVRLQVDVASGYGDVVADMTKKLGAPAEHGYVTYQDVVGAIFQRGKAQWKSNSIAAVVEEYESTVTFVTVTDAHWAAMP